MKIGRSHFFEENNRSKKIMLFRNSSGKYLATYKNNSVNIYTQDKLDAPVKEVKIGFKSIDGFSFLPSLYGPSFLVVDKSEKKIALYFSDAEMKYSDPIFIDLTEQYAKCIGVCQNTDTLLFGYITNKSHIYIAEISRIDNSLMPITIFEGEYIDFHFASQENIWAIKKNAVEYLSLVNEQEIVPSKETEDGIDFLHPSPASGNTCMVKYTGEKEVLRFYHVEGKEIVLETLDLRSMKGELKECFWTPFGSTFIILTDDKNNEIYKLHELPDNKWQLENPDGARFNC